MYNGLERGLREGELLAHTNGLITNDGIMSRAVYSPLVKNIFAYYRIDGNLNDSTGISPKGTPYVSFTYTTGKIGQGMQCDSALDKMIDILDTDNFSFTNGPGSDVPFSISFWCNFASFGTRWIVGKSNLTSGGDEWDVMYTTNRIRLRKFDRANNAIFQAVGTPASALSTGVWYHIVVTDNGSKTVAGMKIYINGVVQTLTDISSVGTYTGMNNGTCITRIGYPSWNLSSFSNAFFGTLDEFGFWRNRALSADDVTQLYNGGNGLTYPF